MNPTKANIRCTFFTNKPVEVDYDKSMKIVAALQAYQLFPFPVNGISFQIGPGGMTPAPLSSYEFRNSDNSINISIGPDRVDVNQCKEYDNVEKAFRDTSDFCLKVMDAFHAYVEFKETRLALASTWILAKDNLEALGNDILQSEKSENLIEWENRRVERKPLNSIGVLVNYGHKVARGQIKLPIEIALNDRIFMETDINTVPLPPDVLKGDNVTQFFDNAIEVSNAIISSFFKKMLL